VSSSGSGSGGSGGSGSGGRRRSGGIGSAYSTCTSHRSTFIVHLLFPLLTPFSSLLLPPSRFDIELTTHFRYQIRPLSSLEMKALIRQTKQVSLQRLPRLLAGIGEEARERAGQEVAGKMDVLVAKYEEENRREVVEYMSRRRGEMVRRDEEVIKTYIMTLPRGTKEVKEWASSREQEVMMELMVLLEEYKVSTGRSGGGGSGSSGGSSSSSSSSSGRRRRMTSSSRSNNPMTTTIRALAVFVVVVVGI